MTIKKRKTSLSGGSRKGSGAPRLYGKDVTHALSFSTSSGLYKQLKKSAKEEKRSMSFIINSILCEHFSMGINGKRISKK